MALIQTVNLEQTVDSTVSPPLVSTWVAAHNPVYLEWIRKDTLVTDTESYGPSFKLSFIVGSNTGYSPGDKIYANTTAISGVFTVDSLVSTNRIVTTKTGYSTGPSGPYPGYINNLTTRKNYYIEIELTNANGTTQLALLQATPNTSGVIGIDISGALQSYLTNEEGFDIIVQNVYADVNGFVAFKYRTKEYWTGSAESWSSLSDVQYGVNGAFQIGHDFNGNYAEYYPENNLIQSSFISDFEEPTGFEGYPLDIGFIYPDTLTDTSDLTISIEYYDYDGVLIAGPQSSIPNSNVNNFVRVKINAFDVYNLNKVKYILVKINDDIGQILKTFKINIRPMANLTQNGREPFECDGIYLQWLGEKGNRSYFWFNNLYNESIQVEGGGTYQKSFDAIDDLTERVNWFEKKAFKKLVLGAENLTKIEIDGLKTLLKSPKVFVVDPATFKLTGVLVEPGTFEIGRGDQDRFKIEFSIVYPEQFNQTA